MACDYWLTVTKSKVLYFTGSQAVMYAVNILGTVQDRLLEIINNRKWYDLLNSTFLITWSDLYLLQAFSDVIWCCWRCWLGGRKGIRPGKNWVVGCWRGCLGWGADLHIAQQIPLPLTLSCSSKSRLVLTFLVLPFGTCSPGWSRTNSRRAVKRLCVCVLVNWHHSLPVPLSSCTVVTQRSHLPIHSYVGKMLGN